MQDEIKKQLGMDPRKPLVSIIKGTDSVAEFRSQGIRGMFQGNTNMDHRIDPDQFNLRGIFINPGALDHVGKLFAHVDGLLFNSITEPDINPRCLSHMAQALKNHPRPIINHPTLVMKTRRDEVAKTLAGVDGLIVPKVVRVSSHRFSELRDAIRTARLRYPLLVRSIAAHNQQCLIKIETPEQLHLAEKLPGRGWYATEYVDYRSPDGLYRNYRFFIFATGTIVARNFDIGTDWKVGVHVRDSFMIHRNDLLREVEQNVDNFEQILGKERLRLLQQVRKRMELDYIGMDCTLLPSGEILLFEANVAMNADAVSRPDGKFAYFDRTRTQLVAAFTDLLRFKVPQTA